MRVTKLVDPIPNWLEASTASFFGTRFGIYISFQLSGLFKIIEIMHVLLM